MQKEVEKVNKYISGFPVEVQEKLNQVRKIIIDNAPDAVESNSYGMAAYKMNNKPLVYFGGFATHIGLYATPTGHEKFEKELSKYKRGKGSVQFPFDQPLPVELIADIVKFRVKENQQK